MQTDWFTLRRLLPMAVGCLLMTSTAALAQCRMGGGSAPASTDGGVTWSWDFGLWSPSPAELCSFVIPAPVHGRNVFADADGTMSGTISGWDNHGFLAPAFVFITVVLEPNDRCVARNIWVGVFSGPDYSLATTFLIPQQGLPRQLDGTCRPRLPSGPLPPCKDPSQSHVDCPAVMGVRG